MRHALEAFSITALASLVLSTSAYAQQDAEESARRSEARELTQGAQIHYNLGRFEQALEGYTAAYELFPHPAFLFNLGQCHRELRSYERAVFFFEGYLRELPEADNRELVQELLAESRQGLEQKRAEEERRLEEQQREAEAQRQHEQNEAQRQEAEAEAAAAAIDVDQVDDAVQRRPIHRQWWFWTVIGVVVIGAATGGILAGVLSEDPEQVPPGGSLGTVDWR